MTPTSRPAQTAHRSVLVTGAGTGLGLETALSLAERGFRTYASVLDLKQAEPVRAAAAERRVTLHLLELDITDAASIDAAVSRIVSESGGIYGLVNNAGTRLRGCFEDLTDEEIRRLFRTNIFGTMAVTRAVLPHMRAARDGRIIIITSVAGRVGWFGVSAYCASKFAQEGFGESLALEVAPFGIRVVLVEPGIIRTEAWGAHRVVAAKASDPASPYFRWFTEAERIADERVGGSATSPADVACTVVTALTTRRPRLRYVVGRPAKLVIAGRRHVPGELFERLYFGHLRRRLRAAIGKTAGVV